MKGFQTLTLVLLLIVTALCFYLFHLDMRRQELHFHDRQPLLQKLVNQNGSYAAYATVHNLSLKDTTAAPTKPTLGVQPMNRTLARYISLEDVMTAYEEPTYGNISIPDVNVLQNMSDLDNNTRYVFCEHSRSPGLGNQMFIYASLKGIAVQYGGQLIVPEDSSLRQAFLNLDAVFVSRRLYNELQSKYWANYRNFVVSAKYFKNEVKQLFVNRKFELILGYMQSFRYFHPFLLHIQISAANGLYTFVGVHFRLGDIVYHSAFIELGYTTGTVTYFSHAFDYFREKFKNVIFVIISNELAKARQILKELDKGDLYFLNAGSREVEMATLTHCNHTIMSTGTFSWWIAYLTGGTTIYYKDWPKAGSKLDKDVFKKDYFLEEWIPMA